MREMTVLEILNDQRDDLINEIADLQIEMAGIQDQTDAAQIELHDVDLQIKELQRNATKTEL